MRRVAFVRCGSTGRLRGGVVCRCLLFGVGSMGIGGSQMFSGVWGRGELGLTGISGSWGGSGDGFEGFFAFVVDLRGLVTLLR